MAVAHARRAAVHNSMWCSAAAALRGGDAVLRGSGMAVDGVRQRRPATERGGNGARRHVVRCGARRQRCAFGERGRIAAT